MKKNKLQIIKSIFKINNTIKIKETLNLVPLKIAGSPVQDQDILDEIEADEMFGPRKDLYDLYTDDIYSTFDEMKFEIDYLKNK